MIFAIEPLAAVWNEWLELAALQWAETEGYRHDEVMAPSFQRYHQYEQMGCFRMFTARDGVKLVGSCGVYVVPSMHTQMLLASEDSWYLKPEYRKGRNAIDFYKYGEEQLRKMGVTRIDISSKIIDGKPSTGRLMQYLGYQEIGVQYSKPLK